MPEGRFISKTIAHSEDLAGVSFHADYLFTRCIPHLDREGRMNGNAELVKAIAVPLRKEITAETIPALLAELADARPAEVAYVGDRADNDVLPALAAGLVAFHLRRGPWGRLQETPEGAVAIDSLLEVRAYVGATSAVGA